MSEHSTLRSVLATVVAPVTVTTALLYYFGWVRSNAIAEEFGYDPGLLELGAQDYILRSVQPMILPILAGVALAVVWMLFHGKLAAALDRGRFAALASRPVRWILLASGVVIVALAMWAVLSGGEETIAGASILLPAVFVLAAFLIGYGAWLSAFAHGGRSDDFRLAPPIAWTVISLLLFAAFTATAVFARSAGERQAEANVEAIDESPFAILTSDERLGLEGVPSQIVDGQHVYSGMVLMFTAGDLYFLLPSSYDPVVNAKVYTVPTSAARIDFDSSRLLPCGGFEDLEEGTVYEPGDVFVSSGVVYRVEDAPRLGGSGKATVIRDDSGDLEVRLRGVSLAPMLDAPYSAVAFRYDQRSEGALLRVNGDTEIGETLVELNLEGALDDAGLVLTDGASVGAISVRGLGNAPLRTVAVGGSDLVVDCGINLPPRLLPQT